MGDFLIEDAVADELFDAGRELVHAALIDAAKQAQRGDADAVAFVWMLRPDIGRRLGVDVESTRPQAFERRSVTLDPALWRKLIRLAGAKGVDVDLLIGYLLSVAYAYAVAGDLPVPLLPKGAPWKEVGRALAGGRG